MGKLAAIIFAALLYVALVFAGGTDYNRELAESSFVPEPTPLGSPREWVVEGADCPAEDSCYVDYRSDGKWYIIEGERP